MLIRKSLRVVKTVYRLVRDAGYRRRIIASTGVYNHLSDEKCLLKLYYANTGRTLNLDNPLTFNEKLQWLKLHDRKPIYTIMVDKYLVKKYVSNVIGSNHVVPTLGVWDTVEEIDFNLLPQQFVLKCNHNSGLGMCICKDKSKLDIGKVKKELVKGMNQDYYIHDREWPYKNIQKRIIAEKYIEDNNVKNHLCKLHTDGLIDYKFYCFNGEPKFLYVGFANIENGVKRDLLSFLTLDWKPAPFYRVDHEQIPNIPDKPLCFDEMLKYATKLSENIPFVRVDFFLIDDHIFFSEFTFTPGGGYGIFHPAEWEKKLGDWLVLPDDKGVK